MIEFQKDGYIYQITFCFPDKKRKQKNQRHTLARLSVKIVNAENPEDYVWNKIRESLVSRDSRDILYDKHIGRKKAFALILLDSFPLKSDKEFRTQLWKQFFKVYHNWYKYINID